ncbi:MAG: hypothetical protein M4579_005953 [Chaenotheca gracillima]|nr:MAG: hypothetical protein M4579_005953 [Chaenotheca gracillima]
MGRYNFRALRVHQSVTKLLQTDALNTPPPWYNIIGKIPPAQTIVRTQPVQHHERPKKVKSKKASKQFKPFPISYEEDRMREQFFKDHPWELARPRVVLENDGKDGQKIDWSQMKRPGRRVDGESVVQRQLWLLHNDPSMNPARAYDLARHEFYDLRHQEDVERRVAREEAEATGAYFGKTALEVGMELEDKAYEDWKTWALAEAEAARTRDSATQAGYEGPEQAATNPDDPEVEAGLEEVSDSIPAQGKDAQGGVPVHP